MQIEVELSAHGPRPGAASPSLAAEGARGTSADCGSPLTVDAMRAAVRAIRAGVFDDVGCDADVAAQAAALRTGAPFAAGSCVLSRGGAAAGEVVLALAAHSGAGASTVALALAEALTACRSVLLVDYAEPLRSGLAAASSAELGLDEGGWRRGRRGQLDIARLDQPQPVSELPPPPQPDGDNRVLVVDPGWALTTALLVSDRREWLTGSERLVVVTRLTVPGVRQAEHLLAALGRGAGVDACVAAVCPYRWPRGVEANYGPNLGRLQSEGRLVRMPMESRLEGRGLTADPLPKTVAAAGRALAALLVPSQTASERR